VGGIFSLRTLRRRGTLGLLACLLGAGPVWVAAASPEAGPEANTVLAAARLQLDEGQARYAEGDFAAAEKATQAAGRLLYDSDARPELNWKNYAALTSRLSLLTLRLNRLVHDVSPELDPERFTMPIPYNPRIEREIDRYLTSSREEFARWLRRSGRYLPKLVKYFKDEALPEDLVYVALIESGFNPLNRSEKEAVGLFQFMLATGEQVGLKNDSWVDERRDPDKAAQAAVQHLHDLYREFGDWDLALAAYNAGSVRVWQAIRRQGTRDYWQLLLPPETESYVPKFYAALVISREPELYGFNPVLEDSEDYDEVEVPGSVDFKVIAECAGVTPSAVAALNTELTKGCTPPGDEPYTLRLPAGTGDFFQMNFVQIPEKEKFLGKEEIASRKFKGVYLVYKVRPGDDLYTIARKHHTTVPKIREWNSFTRGKKYIHPGDKLRIYRLQ
jgi:membrane-bound lytic murein transglycosylase D